MIQFHVPGAPQGKGRARAYRMRSGAIGHYTPDKTRSYERTIRLLARQAVGARKPIDGPVSLTLQIVMPIPASWPAWKRDLAQSGQLAPTTKPDADNIEKAVKDALNGVVYRDDAQVVAADKIKCYEDGELTVGVHVGVSVLPLHSAQIKTKPRVSAHVESV